jgi:hypothetical protein
MLREIVLTKKKKYIAAICEETEESPDFKLMPSKIEFSKFATDEDRERITRIVESSHSWQEGHKFITALPSTLRHMKMLPDLFLKLGYQAELIEDSNAKAVK